MKREVGGKDFIAFQRVKNFLPAFSPTNFNCLERRNIFTILFAWISSIRLKKYIIFPLILLPVSEVIAIDVTDEATILPDYSDDSSPSLCNSTTEALFNLELKTDIYPTETSWKLMDIYMNRAIHQIVRGNYARENTLYEKKVCIPRASCYQFALYDQWNDGICCNSGDGYYKVIYDNVLIIEGGDFGSYEKSIYFGEACLTSSPSISSSPTLSLSPTSKPSISSVPSSLPSSIPTDKPSFSELPSSQPSIHPSLSLIPSQSPSLIAPSVTPSHSSIPTPSESAPPSNKPSVSISTEPSSRPSSQPSCSPTISNVPTMSQEEINLIAVDKYGRRYFPHIITNSDKSYSCQPFSKCETKSFTSTTEHVMVTPDWAGKISTAYCYVNVEKKYCGHGVPMSEKSESLPVPLVSINPLGDDSVVNLPGGAELRTSSLIAADVNGDGMLDIIIGNYGQSNQLLLNEGGRFLNAVDLPGGVMDTTSIAAADINGDGMVDIIVGNEKQLNQMLINQGGGNYEALFLHGTGLLWTFSIALADVNGDGMVDIIIANIYTYYGYYGEKNQLLINDGYGSFTEAIDLPGYDRVSASIIAADVNSDGMVDIIIGNYGQSNQLLLNKGGMYSEAINLPGGEMYTLSIATADVNGDGMVDIIIGNVSQNNQLLLNDGDGTYSDAVDLPGGTLDVWSLTVADINGDGMVDIIIGNNNENNQLLINQGDGSYSEAINLPGGTMATRYIAAVDMNGDDMVDIFVGNDGQMNQLLMNQFKASYLDFICPVRRQVQLLLPMLMVMDCSIFLSEMMMRRTSCC